ncbi:hypothetical protein M9Y10_016418 [Tritrichomonas musculus]|uniref:DUF3447 domain-containing protein n=1 Tax=Tritrichomonas musculus TaxID=1915356 RepID=A0ABR2HW84_9EUKA
MISEDEFDKIFDIRSSLSSISIDNIDQFSRAIVESPFCSTEEKLSELFDMIFLFASIRPKQIQALCTLSMNIYSAREDNPILGNVRSILLKKFHAVKSSNTNPLTSWGHFSYLHMCFIQFLLSDEEIVEEINKFVDDHPGSKHQILFICSWFLPEIERINHDLFKQITHSFIPKSPKNTEEDEYLILKNFYKPSSIEKLKANDWSYYRDLISSAYVPNSLGDAIRSDNFELFKELSNKFGFDVNTQLQPSLFLQIPFLQDSPTLIQAAAFFASVNIFKFLMLNNADLNLTDNKKRTLPFFAVAGGSSEIIRTCQQQKLPFKFSTIYAIQFHHQDVFNWLLDTIPDDLTPEIILQEASKWGNLELVHDLLISNMVFSYSDYKFNDFILRLRYQNILTICSFDALAGDYSQILDILIKTNNKEINLNDFKEEEEEEEEAKDDLPPKRLFKILLNRENRNHSSNSDSDDSGIDHNSDYSEEDEENNMHILGRRFNIRVNGMPIAMNQNHHNFNFYKPNSIPSYNPFIYRTHQESQVLKKKKLKELLLAASDYNSIKCLEIICKELNNDVFYINKNGFTPLHNAAKNGFLEFIKHLLECNQKGIESNPDYQKYDINGFSKSSESENSLINNESNNQITPLYLAVLHGHTEVAKYLLGNGALFGEKIHKQHSKNEEDNSNTNFLDELHIAAREGYIQILKLFLNLNPEVNNPDQNGITPLCYASQNNQVESVKLLLSTPGVDPNNSNNQSNTSPLYIACNLGYHKIVKEFIDYNKKIKSSLETNNNNNDDEEFTIKPTLVDVNQVCVNGRTPIFAAIFSKSVRTVKALLESNDIQINLHEDLNESTPIHIACELGLIDVVKILLHYPGIDLNVRDKYMNTPLHVASDRGFEKIVKSLLSIEDSEAEKAKKLQEKKRKQELKQKRKQAKETARTDKSADNNDDNKTEEEEDDIDNQFDDHDKEEEEEDNYDNEEEEEEQKIVKFAIDINAVNKDMKTALHLASMNDKSDCLDYLIAYQPMEGSEPINVNCKDTEGNTPLMYASIYDNYYSVSHLLLVEGIDVLTANNENWTALHFAASKDNDDVIQLLLVPIKSIELTNQSEHSLINAKTNGGYTALHLAAAKKAEAAMRVLLEEEKVEINAKCNNGKTPLHFAATYGFVVGVKMLLSHIPQVTEDKDIQVDEAYLKDDFGMTPLDYARKYKRDAVIKLFEERAKK